MLNFSITARLLAVCCLLASAGCNTLPAYAPAPAEKTVTAKLLGYGKPFMCKEGKRYSLDVSESDGYQTTQLPVGARLTVWRYMSYQGYNVISSCSPTISLIPKEGVGLIIHSGLAGGKCFIEAVREDVARDTGVALDPTIGAPAC
jgi:hypothetical protein